MPRSTEGWGDGRKEHPKEQLQLLGGQRRFREIPLCELSPLLPRECILALIEPFCVHEICSLVERMTTSKHGRCEREGALYRRIIRRGL